MSSRDVSVSSKSQWIEQHWRMSLIAIVLMALTLRIGAAALVELRVQESGTKFLIEGDANGYWHLGEAIANGDDYSIHQPPRRVLRVPGFPLLLAGSIRLFGDSIWAARVVLAVIGAACCWFTYRLGHRLMNRQVGIIAALIVAIHPFHVGMSTLILSETLFTFWMLTSLLALAGLIGAHEEAETDVDQDSGLSESPARQHTFSVIVRAVLTGLLIACAVLIRPGFILWLVPAVVAILWFVKSGILVRILCAVTLVAAFGLTMLPWAIRNHNVTGHWVVTSLWSGPSLYDGLHPGADGTSDMSFFDEENVMADMSEYEMNAHYQQRAVAFARSHPGRTIELAMRKAARFLQPAPSTPPSTWAIWVICSLSYIAFVGLCLTGISTHHMNIRFLLVCVGPFLLFLGVHMVFVGSLRYRLPTEFPLAIVAAAGLRTWLLPQRKTETQRADSRGRRNGN
jgi:4-amino-4-deoxy-L-arabinose transferase-like glycosyltransferase